VRDTLELVDSLGREKGIWVGHDVGSLVVWTVASHHPERCSGVVSLCIPYLKKGFAADNLIPLVDRAIYPQDTYPAGQWDYILFYEEGFEAAHTAFEANTRGSIAALFRRGNAALRGTPSRTAQVRRDGGWFGGGKVPDVERDAAVLTEADLSAYTASLEVRPKCLVHEPQTERRLCSDLGQRRSIEHAGAVQDMFGDWIWHRIGPPLRSSLETTVSLENGTMKTAPQQCQGRCRSIASFRPFAAYFRSFPIQTSAAPGRPKVTKL
jgi:pimeloyl-ACP methyl ester carboxylesterase